MKKVLITGATGFAGSFLTELFVSSHQFNICGTYQTEKSLQNVSEVSNNVLLKKVDFSVNSQVNELIKKEKPDLIFHLAALTSPGDSFKNSLEAITINFAIEVNLLEAVKIYSPSTRVVLITSADVYGGGSKKPISEEAPFMPDNPYAVSKVAQDYLGLQYFISHNLDIVRVRPFNHIGPRQSPQFVVASFAKKIALLEKTSDESKLKVGNIETARDFTDVRDTVKAYYLLSEKGKKGDVYNVGSGKSIKIKEILEKLLSFSTKKLEYEIDQSLYRPSDTNDRVCDNSKLKNLTGWEPTIPMEQSLKETLDYWRKIL